ncbi:hypothetical protein GGF32_000846 [Allomyces javanicus]|nr:hypothetical protein GGF32_000846 [Allomyces javanicus]
MSAVPVPGSAAADQGEQLYCICRSGDDGGSMVFHAKCVGLGEHELDRIESDENLRWHCPRCPPVKNGLQAPQPAPQQPPAATPTQATPAPAAPPSTAGPAAGTRRQSQKRMHPDAHTVTSPARAAPAHPSQASFATMPPRTPAAGMPYPSVPAPPPKKLAVVPCQAHGCDRAALPGSAFCTDACYQQTAARQRAERMWHDAQTRALAVDKVERGHRDKTRSLLRSAFVQFIQPADRATALAAELEATLYAKFAPPPDVVDPVAPATGAAAKDQESSPLPQLFQTKPLFGTPAEATYKREIRNLYVQLKNAKLGRLRANLQVGEWTPAQIVDMDPSEFSAEALEQREKLKAESIQSVIRHSRDQDKLVKKTHKGDVEVHHALADVNPDLTSAISSRVRESPEPDDRVAEPPAGMPHDSMGPTAPVVPEAGGTEGSEPGSATVSRVPSVHNLSENANAAPGSPQAAESGVPAPLPTLESDLVEMIKSNEERTRLLKIDSLSAMLEDDDGDVASAEGIATAGAAGATNDSTGSLPSAAEVLSGEGAKSAAGSMEAAAGSPTEETGSATANPDAAKDLDKGPGVVWQGMFSQTGVPDLAATPLPIQFVQIGGRSLENQDEEVKQCFTPSLQISGRIQPTHADRYVSGLKQSSSREVFIFEAKLPPSALASDESLAKTFDTVFKFYRDANRYAVVKTDEVAPPAAGEPKLGARFKDMYLLPIQPRDEVPEFFDFFTHTFPAIRSAPVLLAVLVAHRPIDPNRRPPPPPPSVPFSRHATRTVSWDNDDWGEKRPRSASIEIVSTPQMSHPPTPAHHGQHHAPPAQTAFGFPGMPPAHGASFAYGPSTPPGHAPPPPPQPAFPGMPAFQFPAPPGMPGFGMPAPPPVPPAPPAFGGAPHAPFMPQGPQAQGGMPLPPAGLPPLSPEQLNLLFRTPQDQWAGVLATILSRGGL